MDFTVGIVRDSIRQQQRSRVHLPKTPRGAGANLCGGARIFEIVRGRRTVPRVHEG